MFRPISPDFTNQRPEERLLAFVTLDMMQPVIHFWGARIGDLIMLVVTRKKDEKLIIGNEIEIQVLRIGRDKNHRQDRNNS